MSDGIFYSILSEFELEFILSINFKYIFYILLFLILIFVAYLYAWRKIERYSKMMDMYTMELWQREDSEITNSKACEDVKKIRLERLKGEYEDKIDAVRRKRSLVFKTVPLMKVIYRYKKSDKTPTYLLP